MGIDTKIEYKTVFMGRPKKGLYGEKKWTESYSKQQQQKSVEQRI